ncbi:MAG TPA: GNAT family N-acetyltransferase [Pyrinomonadaceae bacterium]
MTKHQHPARPNGACHAPACRPAAPAARNVSPARHAPPAPHTAQPKAGVPVPPRPGARPLPSPPARGGTAQRREAVASAAPAGFRVLPPTPLGAGRRQIKVTVAGSPKVAGSVDIRPAGGGKAYISNLKVESDFRRQGLGGRLMDAALQSARGQGFTAAQLEARPSDSGITSQALVSMYRRMGFRSVGKSSRGNPLMERIL